MRCQHVWIKFSYLTIALIVIGFCAKAQKHNWQNLDLQKDSVFGISTEKAYTELLKNKKPTPVIVAIMDSGVDTTHEDLKPVFWISPKDGSQGRNYIGSESGKEDVTNLAALNKAYYDSLAYTRIPEAARAGYQAHRKLFPEYLNHVQNMEYVQSDLRNASTVLDDILKKMGKTDPVLSDFKQYQTQDDWEMLVVSTVVKYLPLYPDFKTYRLQEITKLQQLVQTHLDRGLNIEDVRSTVQKDTKPDRNINPDAMGISPQPNYTAFHGTHVAGIIGAVRNNGKGMDGVADDVQIMMLKVIGNIRELRDANLAAAIRFAVDNGAKILNLSFGKTYTWDKKAVDAAVQYAMQKDVLIIWAAGNSGEDLGEVPEYPNPVYLDGKTKANAWISVGASGWKDDSTLALSFSNYGKNTVDVFAPGEKIYATIPYSSYEAYSGTSMAAPVVTGLAALIREYYPKLTAIQVKEIIMKSVVKREVLKDKCVSGGVVNAYNALKLAETY